MKNTSCSVQQMIWNKDVQKTEERKQDKKEKGKRQKKKVKNYEFNNGDTPCQKKRNSK